MSDASGSNWPDFNKLRAAVAEALGFEVIPLRVWNAVAEGGKREGKVPLARNWRAGEPLTARRIREMMAEGHNMGNRLTRHVGVVDVDPRAFPKEGELNPETQEPLPPDPRVEFERRFGVSLSSLPTVLTGSRHEVHGPGAHHYMRIDLPADWGEGDRLRNTLPGLKGIEFKTLGRQVVMPGSVHPDTGLHYEWSPDHPDPALGLPPAPAALVEALRVRPGASASASEEGAAWEPAVLEEFLAALDPTDFRDHDEWLKLMIACNAATGGLGLEEFTAWSTSDPNYAHAGASIAYRWDTFDPDRDGGRTLKTLEWIARERGVDLPALSLARADFSELAAELGDDLSQGDAGPEVEGGGLMAQLHRRYCHVIGVGPMRRDWDPDLSRHVWVRLTKGNFLDHYNNRKVEVRWAEAKSGVMKAGDAWYQSPHRRSYDGLTCRPHEPPNQETKDHRLNLWTGFAYEPSPEGSWSALQDLIYEGIAGGVQEHADYVLDWMAAAVQRPGRPGEVALVLKGSKGTGKGTLGSAFVKLFGSHGMQINSPTLLTGRFNAHMRDCIALFADEALWAGSREAESVLKGLITERQITFEAKGRDPEQGLNMLHIVMASNLDWVVPAGMDGERRFAVFEVDGRFAVRQGGGEARNFFSSLYGQLDNHNFAGRRRMLHDLLTRDLDRGRRWHPFDCMPKTRALHEQQQMGLNLLEEFVLAALEAGDATDWRPHHDSWEDELDGCVRVLKRDFEEAFRAYAESRGMKHRQFGLGSGTGIAKALKAVFGPAVQSRKMSAPPEGRAGVGARPAEWVFPSLSECRSIWARRAEVDITWDQDG